MIGSGGGITMYKTEKIEISQSNFYMNVAMESGASILVDDSDEVNLANVLFKNNTVLNGDGGCITMKSVSSIGIAHMFASLNIAQNSGGVISVS